MIRRFITAAAVASTLLFAVTVSAQEGGHDEVTLKNGGTIRGTVVSSEPGTSVKIIEMGQREVRVIPWAQVGDVERGKYAPKAQPGPTGPGYGYGTPAPPPEPKLGTPGVVRLHLVSPEPAQVIEHVGTSVGGMGGYTVVIEQLRPVCTAPCGQIVDGTKGQAFAVTGRFPMPRPFNLNGYTGDVTLHLKPGSSGLRIGGVMAIIFGGSALIPGVTMLAIGSSSEIGTSTMKSAGIGLTVGGALVLTGGIVMAALSGSKLQIEEGGPRTGKIEPRYWMGEF